MRITKGYQGNILFVFKDEYHASKYSWLFIKLLRMNWICADGYYNGFSWS